MVSTARPRDHTPLPDAGIARFRLPHGRHRGRLLTEVPIDYLVWLADEHSSPTVRALARQALRLGEEADEDGTEPSRALAAVALPGITYRWWQAMRGEFDEDRLALEVVGRGLHHLQRLCTEYTRKSWSLDVRGAS